MKAWLWCAGAREHVSDATHLVSSRSLTKLLGSIQFGLDPCRVGVLQRRIPSLLSSLEDRRTNVGQILDGGASWLVKSRD